MFGQKKILSQTYNRTYDILKKNLRYLKFSYYDNFSTELKIILR